MKYKFKSCQLFFASFFDISYKATIDEHILIVHTIAWTKCAPPFVIESEIVAVSAAAALVRVPRNLVSGRSALGFFPLLQKRSARISPSVCLSTKLRKH